MSDQNSTPLLGKFLGLPIPEGASLELEVKDLSAEQCEALLHGALNEGLPVEWDFRGVTIGWEFELSISLDTPADFPSESEFMAKRAKPTEPFEIAAPGAVIA